MAGYFVDNWSPSFLLSRFYYIYPLLLVIGFIIHKIERDHKRAIVICECDSSSKFFDLGAGGRSYHINSELR